MSRLRSVGQFASVTLIVGLSFCATGQLHAQASPAGAPAIAGDAAAAQANYDTASNDYAAASSNLIAARAAALKQAATSPEFLAAQQDVETTYQAYTALKRQTVQQVDQSNPEYQALTRQAAAAQATIDAARNTGTATPEEFSALYNKKAAYTSQMKAIEDQARDAAGVADAEKQWRQASAALERLSAQQKAAVENAPSVVQAKQQLQAARANLDKANTQLATAQGQLDELRNQEARQDYQNRVNADLIQRFGGDDDDNYYRNGYGYRGGAVIRGGGRRR